MMKAKGAVIGICIADLVLLVVCAFLYLRQDRTAPVISFGENDIVYTEDMDLSLLLNGITATDNKDGDVTDTLLIEKISDTARGDVIVTYAALDSANNVAKASRIFPAKTQPGRRESVRPVSEETDTAPEPETETETQTASEDDRQDGQGDDGEHQDDQAPQDGQADGNDNQDDQARRDEEPDNKPNEDRQNDAGADMDPEESPRENAAPVLRLKKETLTVKAGVESVNWNDCIRSLSDDKDSREQLFSNLVMEGNVDLNIPGEYPVTIYTKDSEGMESERKTVVVRVE